MTHSQDWMDVNNGFYEVWCNPTTKSYGFEHPIQEVPTDNFDSGIVSTVQSGKRSVLKKAGIPISSRGWTNHEGMVSNQVGTSEHPARSQIRQAKEASTAQHTKRQKANPSTSTEVTWADLNTVAIGSSSNKNGDDEDGGKDRPGNTAETEDNEYCPLANFTSQPTRRQPNPPPGESTTTMAGKNAANPSMSRLLAPPPNLPKATLPRVVVQRSSMVNPIASTSRVVSPGVDDLEPKWIPTTD
ncbi:hypothetical protein BY996DRAFT_6410358 [Phakopsora pachyrhizi]|nr:hypothetical protein BY996DRAFT_6410358 [Phakopsora pachyrhizi]